MEKTSEESDPKPVSDYTVLSKPTEITIRRPPVNSLNDLSAKEWIPETVSVWTQRGLGKGHKDAQIEKQHPAPFSFQDISRLVRFFTKSGDTVLDPFVGVGSSLKAAAIEGRKGIGIELNPRYSELARMRLMSEVSDEVSVGDQHIINGDARRVIPTIEKNSVKELVTLLSVLFITRNMSNMETMCHLS